MAQPCIAGPHGALLDELAGVPVGQHKKMKFQVRALEGDDFKTVEVDALDQGEALRLVRERGLTAVSATAMRVTGAKGVSRRRRFDLLLFSQELEELLVAGLGVVEAVEALSVRRGDDETTQILSSLLVRMREGHTFSAALESMTSIFPPLYIGLIRASEKTSNLQDALARYLDYRGRFDQLRSRITSALVYPAVLIAVSSIVIMLLGGWVIPKFAMVFQASGRELPLLSRWLLDWGMLVNHYRLWLICAISGFAGTTALWVWQAARGGKIEALVARLPGMRERVEVFRMSRLYLAFGTLLNGGMPAVQALQLVEGVVPASMIERLRAVADALRRGEAITRALEHNQLTTPVALRLLQVGEGAGRLGEMFVRAARYHDNELSRWIERFTRVFEPLLMAVIGIVIGTVVILLYMPIFELTSGFQ